MWSQQPPPAGGPPLQAGMPPPQGGLWGNPQGRSDDDYGEQSGSALNSAVGMVTSAASGLFSYANRQQQTHEPQPPVNTPHSTPVQRPPPQSVYGAALAQSHPPQQPPPAIQPTSSLLSRAAPIPAQQPPPISVHSSLLTPASRRIPGGPHPSGGTAPMAPSAVASGPPPLSATGPPPLAASAGPPKISSTVPKHTPAPVPFNPSQSNAANTAKTPVPATTSSTQVGPPTTSSSSSVNGPPPDSSRPPSGAVSSPASAARNTPPTTPKQTEKPAASLSALSSSTKRLPLPPRSTTLERRKRAGTKFKLPPAYKSTTPTSTPISTKETVQMSDLKSKDDISPKASSATSEASSGPSIPYTPIGKPPVADSTPKFSNVDRPVPASPVAPTVQPAAPASSGLPSTTVSQRATPEVPKTAAPVPAPPTSSPPQQESANVVGKSVNEETLLPGWVELIHEDSGSKYYWNEKDGTTTWERPVVTSQTKDPSALPAEFDASVDNRDEEPAAAPPTTAESAPKTVVETVQPVSTTTEGTNQLPEGWVEAVDEASGSTYYVNTADNTTTWSRPALGDLTMDTPTRKPIQPEQAPEEEKTETSPKLEEEKAADVASLPPGWMELIDEVSGRSYYVRQEDNWTTWERPEAAALSPAEKPEAAGKETEETRLTAAMHEESLETGQSPELTHNEDRHIDITADVPRSPAEADTTMAILEDLQEIEPPLAPGWTEHFDPDSGRKFYVNDYETIRRWVRPVAVAENDVVNSAAEDAKPVNIEPSQSAPEVAGGKEEGFGAPEVTESNEETQRLEGEVADASTEVIESERGPALPLGWVEAFDPSSNRPYYFNAETNETRWEPPAAENQPSDGIEKDRDNETESEYVMVDRPESEMGLSAPEVTQDTSNASATISSPELNDQENVRSQGRSEETSSLAPGWKELVDPTSGRPYYVNEAQNRTVWEKPQLETASMLSSIPDVSPDGGEADIGIARDVIEEKDDDYSDEPQQTDDVGPLPPGWEEMVDPNTKVTFYYNEAEGKSSWERPVPPAERPVKQKPPSRHTTIDELNSAPGSSALDVSDQGQSEVKGEATVSEVHEAAAEMYEEPGSLAGDDMNEAARNLAPGWVEAIDPLSGRIYYVNEAEGTSSWEKPIFFSEAEQDGEATSHHDEEAEQAEKYLPELTAPFAEKSNYSNADDELPPGWVAVDDPSTGSAFYFNEAEQITTWEKPSMSQSDKQPDNISVSMNEQGTPLTEVEDAESSSKEQSVLPPGWEKVTDSSTGSTYYFNASKNITTMEKPKLEKWATKLVNTDGMNEESAEPGQEEQESNNTQEVGKAEPESTEAASIGTLPPGWAEAVDPATGEAFYFNESEGLSSWERPVIRTETETMRTDALELEQDQMEASEHTKAEAGLENASLGDSNLPPGWIESEDPVTGTPFYFNETENLTSWEKPSMPTEGDVHSAEAQEAAKGNVEKRPEEPLDHPEVAQAEGPAEIVHVAESELPPGWVATVDPGTGNTFYFNEVENLSSWVRPIISSVEVTQSEKGGAAETVDDGEAVLEPEKRVPSPPWTAAPEQPTTIASEPELPPGWVEATDPDSGSVYYFNEIDNVSSWERPTQVTKQEEKDNYGEPVMDSDGPLAPSLSEELLQTDESGKLSKDTIRDDGSKQTEKISEKMKTADDVAPKSELPLGWTEVMDPSSGRPYFVNEIDNTRTWDRPTASAEKQALPEEVDETDDFEDVSNRPEQNEQLDNEKHQTELEQPVKHSASLEPGTQLPPGWDEGMDPATGNTFYYNEAANLSSWERPVLEAENEVTHDRAEVVDSPKESAAKLMEHSTGGRVPSEEVNPAVENNNRDEPGQISTKLPPGWVEAIDPSSGNVFYFNEAENITCWDPPMPEEPEEDTLDVSEHATGADTAGLATGEAEEPEVAGSEGPISDDNGLPPGWLEAIDPRSGDIFYINEATNVTRWDRPSHGVDVNQPDDVDNLPEHTGREPRPSEHNEQPLADGWRQLSNSNGEVYYYNETLGQTQWERPAVFHQPMGKVGDAKASAPVQTDLERPRPAHAFATFGFGGRLCIWRSHGKRETINPVEIHRTCHVAREHRIVQIELGKQKAGIFGPLDMSDPNVVKSYVKEQGRKRPSDLLWHLLRIVSASKGKLRSEPGVSDPRSPEAAVVDLLLKEGVKVSAGQHAETNDIPGPAQSIEEEDRNGNGEHSSKSKLEAIQNLILRGKRVMAVELAMESNNFALALLVAAYCDPETYQRATKQFAEKVLQSGSPLHTITLLFSGQILESSLWSDRSSELPTSWPYHLAAIISNRTQGWERVVFTLGTQLQQLGDVNAAHFCFMVCGLQLSSPVLPHTYVSLLGCDHLLPEAMSLMTAEGNDAYERTEAYEWAKRRGNKSAVIKTLQPFKLKYAMILADLGYVGLARKYLQSILVMCDLEGDSTRFDTSVPANLTLPEMCDSFESFKAAVGSFEQRLFRTTPLLIPDETKQSALPVVGGSSPHFHAGLAAGTSDDLLSPNKSGEADISFQTAATHLPDATMVDFSSKKKDAPTLARVTRKTAKHEMDGTGPTKAEEPRTALQSGPSAQTVASAPPSQFRTPKATPRILSDARKEEEQTNSSTAKKPKPSPKSAPAAMQSKKGGWLSGIREMVTKKLNPDATTADIGESMQAYYDEDKKVWVFPGEDPAELAEPPPPPPTTPMNQTEKQEEKPAPDMAKDPLAAMMAPPQRTPATLARARAPGGGIGAATPRSLYGMPPGMPPGSAVPRSVGAPGSASAGGTPQFMIFQPKPEDSSKLAAKAAKAAADEAESDEKSAAA